MRLPWLAPAVLALAAPLAAQAPGNGESWALFRGWSAARRVDFRVPFGPCTRAAELLASELGTTRAVSLDADDRDEQAVRVLVGASWDEELLALLQPLGIEPMAGGFCLLGREYSAPGDALRVVFEDPRAEGRPLCVWLGNDLELLAVYLDELPRLSRPELVAWSSGDLALTCPLTLAGVPRLEEARDYLACRQRYFEGGASFDVEGVKLHVRHPLARARWQEYSLALVKACKRTLGWFGVRGGEAPTIELYLYEHPEDMEECLGASAAFVASRLEPRAHVLYSEDLPHDSGAAAALLLARTLAGSPAARWLEEGQALAASNAFAGWPLEQWIGHLSAGRCLPGPDEVLRADAGAKVDPLVLAPARAFLFLQAVAEVESGAVRALWKGAPLDLRRSGTAYQRRARLLSDAYVAARRGVGRVAAREPLVRGLALVESESTRYSSSWVDEALIEAARLEPRPNAVSLTVFAAAEDPAPVAAGGRARTVYGSSPDLALHNAAATARARGFEVALALEVLAQPNGAWADTLPWAAPEDRWQFFGRYERVALHYALLAELLGARVFSFGANLRSTPAGYFEGEAADPQQVAQRGQNWRALIGRLRGAFRGSLTYGASLAGLAREALFYADLDYVSLVFFPGVEGAREAPDDELLRRTLRFELQQALDLAVRWNKPLLLLQTGFPARRDSWAEPRVPRGPEDVAAQARYLALLAEVLASDLENADALRGYFLWNWPIDPEAAAAGDRGFSLRRGTLEAELARLLAR